MSVPPRRRNPIITRGKKSDRKKKKMEKRNRNSPTQVDGFTEILEQTNQQRKELIRGDSSSADKIILVEPSALFFEKTDSLRSKKRVGGGSAILLQSPEFMVGVGVPKVKKERMLVIDGKRAMIFKDLHQHFKEQKANLKQEARESQTEVLERAHKREEQNKKIAAKETEKKRIAIEFQKREAAKLISVEEEKLKSERLAKIELEKQQEVARLLSIEQEKLAHEKDLLVKKKGWLMRILRWKKRLFRSKVRQQTPSLQKENLISISAESGEVEEPVVQEEVLVAEEPVERVIEIEQQVAEIEEPTEGVEIETLEEVVVDDGPDEETPEREEDELPDFQTGEVMLADLRITLRDEPRPIEFITKILMEKHNLSKRYVKVIMEHIASPFSICKTMSDELFYSFISSLDNEKVSSGGVEIWTQVIQIIGLDFLSEVQQVEIYEMFMGDEKKVHKKVKTIAVLYHFLPAKFERWWEKEMIPEFTSKKYNSDYKYYQEKKFSKEIIEETRMLLCAYAIEKPNLVANEYTYAKHQAGRIHENQTEKWLKKAAGGNIEYITQKEIPELSGKKYGNKYVILKITPDILLKKPIQLSADGQHIHWIDAKKHFIDPALSPEGIINTFCIQLDKYVSNYGPGLIVWGKNFSEEWNEATKGVVLHIKI
ncbi:MAG TPA: hypothetical protein EYG10_02620 [Gammaproteobacteria bacterium]|nr:hypothetical protein [Gammaproteobacteria bacterium]